MKVLESIYVNKKLQHDYSEFNEVKAPDYEGLDIIVFKKKKKKHHKSNAHRRSHQPSIVCRIISKSSLSRQVKRKSKVLHASMLELKKGSKPAPTRSYVGVRDRNVAPFHSKFTINLFSDNNEIANPFYSSHTKWRIYRCQLSTPEESCCCSCNSDAMFEVMKSLYDCYKMKNCDHCDCILCGHKHREERRLGELRKSMGIVLEGTPSAKKIKEQVKTAEKLLEGKTLADKEKILKDLAMSNQPLPQGKTASEKSLIKKVRTDLGLPPAPETASAKAKISKAHAAGIIAPLEGKTAKEKEKILEAQAKMGIELPEGRTASEKALVQKVKTAVGALPPAPAKSVGPTKPATPSKPAVSPLDLPPEMLQKAKAAGLVTPLQGKTPAQKEKIYRGLALAGLPLPEGRTASEKKLINKVRADLGLPPEPKNKAMRDKHVDAANAGILLPLEGKSLKEKEKILKGQAALGIPLPEGRTPSEKSLIAKILGKGAPPVEGLAPSVKAAEAGKGAGVLTPLKGKSPAEKEKVFRGLAMSGMPLPEGKTASDKKLINKVRADLGLPAEPQTPEMKKKYEEAAAAGTLQPLEGKSPKEKERILKKYQDIGIPLPEGRTPSEKALIGKIKAEQLTGKLAPTAPSVKTAKAGKGAGVLTPLKGKSPAEKEKVFRGLAMAGMPLPEGKTGSDKKLIDKVRADLGLPVEPQTPEMRKKYEEAAAAGTLQPLEGKSPKEKERILRKYQDIGIPLPEGRTPSEKSLIAKIMQTKAQSLKPPSEKKPIAAEVAEPKPSIAGKTPAEREKMLKALAMQGKPLPEGKSPSDKKLIDKIRNELGMPPEPTTTSMKKKHAKAAEAGLLQPLEGKSQNDKEKILKGLVNMGVPLPVGRTPSEKALISKIQAKSTASITTDKIKKAKAAGLLTPLAKKTAEQKNKILKSLAKAGLPLPEGKTRSEKSIIGKVKKEAGISDLTPSEKIRKAKAAGLLTPLEGKAPAQREKILRGRAAAGLPLPAGKSPSERALVQKIKDETGHVTPSPSERLKRAKAAGILTPLKGKPLAAKEKILKDMLAAGVPIPEGETSSEKALIKKLIADQPKAPSEKAKPAKAAGVSSPLERKKSAQKEKKDLSKISSEQLRKVRAESKRFAGIPSEKLRKAKAVGLLTPLEGKTPAQKEKVLRSLAMLGIPLPELKTASDKKLADKVRADLGVPPEPKSPSMKEKHEKAASDGILMPLEGMKPAEKEKVLKAQFDRGMALPEGRTPSEKALIAKIKGEKEKPPSEKALTAKAKGEKEKKDLSKISSEQLRKVRAESKRFAGIPSEKLRKAKAAGLLTPLEGKTPAQKEKVLRSLAMLGIPLPELKTASDKKLADKVRADLGVPPEPKSPSMKEKHEKAASDGILMPLEGMKPAEKEKVLKAQFDRGMALPEGRTPSEKALIAKIKGEKEKTPSEKAVTAKAKGEKEKKDLSKISSEQLRKVRAESKRFAGIPSEKLRKAKAAGLLTPLEGKTPAQKEKLLRSLAMLGIPLPELKTASDKKLADKVRADLGVPPEPKSPSMKEKYEKAASDGILMPLEGMKPAEKEKVLKAQFDRGMALPEGRTPSEKALIAKIKGEKEKPPSEKALTAKAKGEKEKKDLSKISSEQLRKVRAESKRFAGIPSEKLRKAKAAGLLTPLEGKTPAQKEKLLRSLAMLGIPLPELKTASDKKLADKVRADLGVPPEPKSPSMKEKYEKAASDGILMPLEGMKPAEKEKVLKAQFDRGMALPEGRTPSEKALIAKIKGEKEKPPSEKALTAKAKGEKEKKDLSKISSEQLRKVRAESKRFAGIPSEKLRKAKAAGLLTPLEGKTPAQKEKLLRSLAMLGIPLPELKTASDKKLADKVRADLGVPPEPKSPSMKEKHEKAASDGILMPLEGMKPAEKEKVLKAQFDRGMALPEGRTPSEKALIAKIKGEKEKPPSEKAVTAKTKGEKEKKDLTKTSSEQLRKLRADSKRFAGIPSEKLRKAKAAGLLTPLEGKTPAQKEKLLRSLAMLGIPLPELKTASDKKLADKVRADLGVPPEPKSPSMKEKYEKAASDGILMPLEGMKPAEKEKVLKAQFDRGMALPEGRTPSEKALIAKIKGEKEKPPSEKAVTAKTKGEKEKKDLTKTSSEQLRKLRADSKRFAGIPSEKLRKAKAAGLLTPLEGKTPAQKEKLLRSLAMLGIPLPELKTASDKKLADKVRADLGVPPEPKSPSMKEKYEKAASDGILMPLEGMKPAEKEKVLKAQFDRGMALPEGRTPSEKALIAKIKGEKEKPPEKPPSEKMKKSKAASLLTPLEGKSPAEKEKIVRSLAEAGLPLPEGKSASEKSMIHKIKTELGIPPPAKTPSEKAVVGKAKAEGLFTPLKGKTKSQKQKILKGLAEAGLPLPVGQSISEKAMIKKIRTEAGLPPKATASEKMGKIKTKSKKIGIMPAKESKKAIEVAEEYEDIKKTTKCDRACGCDKKKIRFKHSYVKIRVTSPDISSLCSCPDECIPGVKAGAFIDNEGIKVTVGSAVGITSFSGEDTNTTLHNFNYNTFGGRTVYRNSRHIDKSIKILFDNHDKLLTKKYEDLGSEREYSDVPVKYLLKTTSSDVSDSSVIQLRYRVPHNATESEQSYSYCEGWTGESNEMFETFKRFKSSGILYPEAVLNDYKILESTSRSSFESVMIINSETSLSLTTNSRDSMDKISVMSFADSSVTSNSSHYFGYQLFEDLYSHSSNEEERSLSRIDYDTYGTVTSTSNHLLRGSAPFTSQVPNNLTRRVLEARKQRDYLVFRMSQRQLPNLYKNQGKNKCRSKTAEPIVVINHLNKNRDVKAMIDELLAKNEFSDASSIFVVVPSDNDANSSDGRHSTVCIQMSENPNKLKNKIAKNPDNPRMKLSSIAHGVKFTSKGKKYLLQELPPAVLSQNNKETMPDSKNNSEDTNDNPKKESAEEKADNVMENVLDSIKEKAKDKTTEARDDMIENKDKTKDKDDANHKLCQATIPNKTVPIVEHKCQVVGVDTTPDRPCCCQMWSNDKYLAAKVMSAQINPLLVKQAIALEQHESFMSLDLALSPEVHYRVPHSATRQYGAKKTPQQAEQTQQQCQCSPEKLREMLELAIKTGRNRIYRSVGVEVKTITSTMRDKDNDCKACLKNKPPPLPADSCPCLTKPKSICPCTVDDPPDSEAEPDLKSGGKNEKKSPCPTKGPCGEAAGIVRSSASLDSKLVYINPDDIMSDVELGQKPDKNKHKCSRRTCRDKKNQHKSKDDPTPTKELMKRFGVQGKVDRSKPHKHHGVKDKKYEGLRPHAGRPHVGIPRTKESQTDAKQQRDQQTQECRPPCTQPHCALPRCGLPHCGPPYCDLAHCLQHPCGQPNGQCAGLTQCGPPACGHPQCGKPSCGIPHCGQPTSCKPIHNAPATAQIETGDAQKQLLSKQARKNSTVGTTTDNKYLETTGKKKKGNKCDCPILEQVEVSTNNVLNWDEAKMKKLKSGLTQTTSGFKMNKKKRPPPEPEKEFNIEDAIRFYATLKPELFRDIVEEQEKKRILEGNGKKKVKGKKSAVQCVCSASADVTQVGQSEPSLPSDTETPQSDATLEEDGPFRGLKIRMGGKGSGSPGLTGICCFDMLQDSFTTW